MVRFLMLPSLCWVFFILACSGSPERVKKRLNILAQKELEFIVNEIREKGKDSTLEKSPYFRIDTLQLFSGDTGRKIKAYAVVHYHYLKSDKFFQVRKYRYNLDAGGIWERYELKIKYNVRKALLKIKKAEDLGKKKVKNN